MFGQHPLISVNLGIQRLDVLFELILVAGKAFERINNLFNYDPAGGRVEVCLLDACSLFEESNGLEILWVG